MAAKIDFNPDDLKRIISALTKAEADVTAAMSTVKTTFRGADWHDAQRAKFETMLTDSARKVGQFKEDSTAMKAFLSKLISSGEQYRST